MNPSLWPPAIVMGLLTFAAISPFLVAGVVRWIDAILFIAGMMAVCVLLVERMRE